MIRSSGDDPSSLTGTMRSPSSAPNGKKMFGRDGSLRESTKPASINTNDSTTPVAMFHWLIMTHVSFGAHDAPTIKAKVHCLNKGIFYFNQVCQSLSTGWAQNRTLIYSSSFRNRSLRSNNHSISRRLETEMRWIFFVNHPDVISSTNTKRLFRQFFVRGAKNYVLK